MRVLCWNDKNKGIKEVMEICCMWYDEDIAGSQKEAGYKVQEKLKYGYGLCMWDTESNRLYIEGISREECNELCEKALVTGYCDLTAYNEYFACDEEDDEDNKEDTAEGSYKAYLGNTDMWELPEVPDATRKGKAGENKSGFLKLFKDNK